MKPVLVPAFAMMAAAAVSVTPIAATAAQPKLMPQASESVAPKAKGPKPYQASMLGVCAGQSCQVTFTKKKGKVRRISDISCLLVSATGVALGALFSIEGRQMSYLPLTSRASTGVGEYASGALAIDFEVPPGETLTVELASTVAAGASNCVIVGTIE